MFSSHRPWASGHRAQYTPLHPGGVVEGWIGGELLAVPAPVSTHVWTSVKLIPHFVQPAACVRMTYAGEPLPPKPLYPEPVLSHVVLTTNAPGWPTELGRYSFDYQQEDVVLDVTVNTGEMLMNGQKVLSLFPLGAVWGPDPILHVGAAFPYINSQACKDIQFRIKAAPKWGNRWPATCSLHAWVKQNSLKSFHDRQKWVSDDIETTQHPFCRVHWSIAIPD